MIDSFPWGRISTCNTEAMVLWESGYNPSTFIPNPMALENDNKQLLFLHEPKTEIYILTCVFILG